jgi:hypothetical protein
MDTRKRPKLDREAFVRTLVERSVKQAVEAGLCYATSDSPRGNLVFPAPPPMHGRHVRVEEVLGKLIDPALHVDFERLWDSL